YQPGLPGHSSRGVAPRHRRGGDESLGGSHVPCAEPTGATGIAEGEGEPIMAKTALSPEELLDVDMPVPRLTLYLHHFWDGLKNAISELRRSKTALIGALMLFVLLVLCLLTPYIARYDPIKQNYREMLQTPSAKHYFGTDRYGRDIWSRILWGGRRLLLISLLAVMLGVLVGIPMGTLSGYYGGWVGALAMRVGGGRLSLPPPFLYFFLADPCP